MIFFQIAYLSPLDHLLPRDESRRIPNSIRLLKRTVRKPVNIIKSFYRLTLLRHAKDIAHYFDLRIYSDYHYIFTRILTCMRKYPVCRCKLKDTCNTENSPSRRTNVRFLYGEPIKSNCESVIPGMKLTDEPSCHS